MQKVAKMLTIFQNYANNIFNGGDWNVKIVWKKFIWLEKVGDEKAINGNSE